MSSLQYLGNWYLAVANFNPVTPEGTRCSRATYNPLSEFNILVEKHLKANLSYFSDETAVYARNVAFVDELYKQVCGIAYQPNPDEPGKLFVDFPGSPPGNYWILDTDYDNYNVVYSCNKRGDSLYIFSWINTRSYNPSPEIVS